MTFCIDFDGTLTEKSRYPVTGKIDDEAVRVCRSLQSKGHKLVLYTARKGEDLDGAVSLCRSNGLEFAEIVGGKPLADFYVDDKAKTMDSLKQEAKGI